MFAIQCPQGLFVPQNGVFYFFKLGVGDPVPAGAFLYPKRAPFYFFGGVSVSPGPEGDDDGDGGGRISGHVQARYSITPRD